MKKNKLYIGLTLGLVLTAALLTYYFTSLTADKTRLQGYSLTSYNPPCDSDPEYLEKLRTYETYSLTADSVKNEQTIASIRSYLNKLKITGDSLKGVHVIMTNDMPYKYYIKSVEIFNELPPRLFFTLDNNFYAISKSKYQQTQDSILKTNANPDEMKWLK